MSSTDRQLSIESSPQVINDLLNQLGTLNVKAVDVVSLSPGEEDDRMENVLGILLTIPRKFMTNSEETNEQDGKEVFYTLKKGDNLSGVVSLVNIVANSMDKIKFDEGSVISAWIDSVQELSPEDRGTSLANQADINKSIEKIVCESEEVTHQIIAFTQKDKSVYEMNGMTSLPVKIGEIQTGELVESVAQRCMHYLDGETESKFSLLAIITDN